MSKPSTWQIAKHLEEREGVSVPVPRQWRNRNELRMAGGRTKYRTLKGERYSCDFAIYDSAISCPECDRPHVHSAVLIYRRRRTEHFTFHNWKTSAPQRGTRHHWDVLQMRYFDCAAIPAAVREWEEFPKADLSPVLVEAVL